MAAAITVLLQPWLDGRTKMRPRVLRRWTDLLDEVAAENMTLSGARARGQLSEIAILEMSGGDQALREYLRKWRDGQRASGVPEAEMADQIRRGENTEDGLPI